LLAVGVSAAAIGGCASARGGWDWRALERTHPEIGAFSGERLRDASPYPRPVFSEDGDYLELFLCRWPSGRTLRVALPPDATPDERALLDRALRAWDDGRLGVGLTTADTPADVEIRFAAGGDGSAWPRTALTGADCRADGPGSMDRARIWLDRANLDLLGRPQPLTPEEFLGAALHELGHALGYQGHGVSGPSVVVREVDRVRRSGAAVLAGRPLRDPSLRALYALPPGVVVGRIALDREEAGLLRSLAARARPRGYDGPYVRVGDRSARLFWRGPDRDEVGVVIPRWSEVVRHPDRLRLVVDRAARRWLAAAGRSSK
jgi:hypothetical protein